MTENEKHNGEGKETNIDDLKGRDVERNRGRRVSASVVSHEGGRWRGDASRNPSLSVKITVVRERVMKMDYGRPSQP